MGLVVVRTVCETSRAGRSLERTRLAKVVSGEKVGFLGSDRSDHCFSINCLETSIASDSLDSLSLHP